MKREILHLLFASEIYRLYDVCSTNLIWLTTCLSDLGNNDISINIPVHFWIPLYSNQAMLLTMIQPMACPPCSDYTLKLISFDPNDLFNTLVPPKF